MSDARVHAAHATALAEPRDDGEVLVRAPGVGLWRPALAPGQLVRPGDELGALEVLGASLKIVAPAGARGVIVAIADGAVGHARVAVGHGAVLFRLDPRGAIGGGDDAASRGDAATAASGLAFVAPTSGRYYARPGPDKAPFVSVGDVLRDGHTVCLLEVMKTFNRVVYDAAELGLPAAARVVAIEVGNEQDVDAGTVILRLEEAT